MRPFRIFYFVIIIQVIISILLLHVFDRPIPILHASHWQSSRINQKTEPSILLLHVFDRPIPILHASHWQSSRINQKTEPTWIIIIYPRGFISHCVRFLIDLYLDVHTKSCGATEVVACRKEPYRTRVRPDDHEGLQEAKGLIKYHLTDWLPRNT